MDIYYGHGSLHIGRSTLFPKGKWPATEGVTALIDLFLQGRKLRSW